MNFEAIGESMAMAKVIRNVTDTAQDWIDWSQRQVSIAKAEARATEAGRLAQIHVLRDALAAVAPDHELLQLTGMVHETGNAEVRWHQAFYRPYDAVAVSAQIELCAKALSPAEAARRRVMAEPVACKRVFFCRTWWWRGEQHRTRGGAERARAAEAERAARSTKVR